ncbi:putative transposase [Nocardia nova SH22a]|uniref:Putative transposase n=1 Tax=Nocardia nova SH22a TaxID=1415166 RepID=W5TY75_9NOCA|nr:putative transposase [Nocardia nova SH22a]
MRFTYRLRPGAIAVRALESEWHRCRFLWNEAVHQQQTGRPSFGTLSKMLTEARGRTAWLRAGSQVPQQQMLRAYAQALDHSFKVKGRGRPIRKPRKTALPSLEYTTRGFSIKDGRLRLPNKVVIPVVWSRGLPSEPTSVRVYRDCLGHWYASFVVRREIDTCVPAATAGIGIDWGVSTTATTTDPAYDLPYGGHRKRCAAELARAQRKMARRRRARGQAPSAGYQRARRQAAKICKKAARQNTHAARVWARRVVADHHTIAVEDFKPTFLSRSTMARKAADAAIGAAKRELIERATRAGRKVVSVPPAYTTMICARCGARAKQRLALDERVFECHSCGHTADRDRNAARVILAATVELDCVSADDVRHCGPPPEARGAVRAGNPLDPAVGKS